MILFPPIPPIMIQSVQDVKEVISTNDATIQGVLLGVILALGGALIYLYVQKNKKEEKYQKDMKDLHEKYQGEIKTLNERFIDEIRKMNDKLIDVNNTNFQTIQMIEKMNK